VSRPLAALASLVLSVLGVVLLLPPECAPACTCCPCGYVGGREEMPPAAVFSGEVVDVEKEAATAGHPGAATVALRVFKVLKGPDHGTLEVSTAGGGATCGYPFEEGREYLVYAHEGRRGLEVGICGETKLLSEAGADLAVPGDGERATGGESLSDTSGGFSARTVVGLAGLAMAASLLVVVRLARSG
jgi:hypothetical protein